MLAQQHQPLTPPHRLPNLLVSWRQCPRQLGLFTTTHMIDLNLATAIVEAIPEHTWPQVRDAIVANLVDAMPSATLEALTGEPDGFDEAKELLCEYYCFTKEILDPKMEMIVDALNILGTEPLTYLLDSMQLEKIPND